MKPEYHILFKDKMNTFSDKPLEDNLTLIDTTSAEGLIPAQAWLEKLMTYQYGLSWFYNEWDDEFQLFVTREVIGKIKKVKYASRHS